MTRRRRTLLVLGLVVVLVAGVALAGSMLWSRLNRSGLEQALRVVPASSLRVGYTDWAAVRRGLDADLGERPNRTAMSGFMEKAYDSDFSATSSIDQSAGALQELYGFSPANADWEMFAQGREGAAMVLRVPDADFGELAENLQALGYTRPDEKDGVWEGGVDLVAEIDPTISPELQHVALLEGEGLVVSSDEPGFAGTTARVASGDGRSLASMAEVPDLAAAVEDPVNAMLWAGDFACSDLAMSTADEEDQGRAEELVQRAGGVDPLSGMAMAMQGDRSLEVVQAFEDGGRARENLEPRAKLAVGEAVGRGGAFAEDFTLTSSKAVGATVQLSFTPRASTGFVISALYDGPLIFATC